MASKLDRHSRKAETPLSRQLCAIVPDREMPATPLHRRRAPADAAKVGDFPRSLDVIASCIDDQHCALGKKRSALA